jgi:hypothetical protein
VIPSVRIRGALPPQPAAAPKAPPPPTTAHQHLQTGLRPSLSPLSAPLTRLCFLPTCLLPCPLQMLGRRFCLNPISYMHALLSIPRSEDMSTSFCSQLVAGALKRMGLLPEGKAANLYLPRDFSTANGDTLPLVGGARLGKERALQFDDSPIFVPRTSVGRRLSSLLSTPAASRATLTLPEARATLPPDGTYSPTHAGAGGVIAERQTPQDAEEEARGEGEGGADKVQTARVLTFVHVEDGGGGGGVGGSWAGRAARRMSSILVSGGGASPKEPPMSQEEQAAARREAEAALAHALALYRVRAWLRRRLREKERRAKLAQQQGGKDGVVDEGDEMQPAQSPQMIATPAEIQVEVRRDG